MPFSRYRRFRRPYVRRRPRAIMYRRPMTRRRPRLTMSKFPVAKTKAVHLKYVSDTIGLNPGVASIGSYLFSANGMFDPDITGVGHQPMGYDQWMTFYEHYTVVSAKITATFTPVSITVGTGQYTVGIYTDSDNSPPTVLTNTLEQPGTRYGFLGLAYTNSKQITKTWSAKHFFTKSSVVDDPDISGLAGTNPSEQAYFVVFAGATDGSSDPGALTVNVQIDYYAILSERKTLASS